MDPNANLKEQLTLASEILAIQDAAGEDGSFDEGQSARVEHNALRLAELVEELNAWISKGGFLPDWWRK